jgi:ribonucleoside-diphosphate reductase subunit M2
MSDIASNIASNGVLKGTDNSLQGFLTPSLGLIPTESRGVLKGSNNFLQGVLKGAEAPSRSKLKELLDNTNTDNKTDEPLLSRNLSDFMPDESSKMTIAFKNIYEKMTKLTWFPDEVKTNQDYNDFYNKLSQLERQALTYVVSFFANADSIVADNINCNLGEMVQPFYCKAGYRFIEMMEDIHAITYMKLMMALFPNNIEEIKKEIINKPAIKRKMQFMAKWMATDCSFHRRVIAFLCVEAIMFSASFAIIFYFKSKSLLPGLIKANELISRDEGLHQEYGVLVHTYIKNKDSEDEIIAIIKEAVSIECEFIDEAIPEPSSDLTADRIKQYARFVADRLCEQLGYKKIYNVDNSCSYMIALGVDTKQNFFEKDSTSYLTPSVNKMLFNMENF